MNKELIVVSNILFRYIMDRICEDLGVVCSLDPKPMDGDWNGAGAHCNYRYTTKEVGHVS